MNSTQLTTIIKLDTSGLLRTWSIGAWKHCHGLGIATLDKDTSFFVQDGIGSNLLNIIDMNSPIQPGRTVCNTGTQPTP